MVISTTHVSLSWDPRARLLSGKLCFSTREGRRNYFWGSSLGKKPQSRPGSLDPSWSTSEADCNVAWRAWERKQPSLWGEHVGIITHSTAYQTSKCIICPQFADESFNPCSVSRLRCWKHEVRRMTGRCERRRGPDWSHKARFCLFLFPQAGEKKTHDLKLNKYQQICSMWNQRAAHYKMIN